MSQADEQANEQVVSKADERLSFIMLAVFLAPILSVVIVGGYGFLVWISQILMGPPSA